MRRSSEIIVNVFFGSLVLQASEQQIGVFLKHGGFEVDLDQMFFDVHEQLLPSKH